MRTDEAFRARVSKGEASCESECSSESTGVILNLVWEPGEFGRNFLSVPRVGSGGAEKVGCLSKEVTTEERRSQRNKGSPGGPYGH